MNSLVFFLLGLVAYRVLDLFAHRLKLEQSVTRLRDAIPSDLTLKKQLQAAYKGCKSPMTSWELRRLVRRYRRIVRILDTYDLLAAYAFLFLFAAFGLIIFVTQSADKVETTKYVLGGATIVIALPLSYFGYLVESLKLQADRFFRTPCEVVIHGATPATEPARG